MKATINLILLVISTSVYSQLTYDEKNQIAQEIFDSFEEQYIKSSFVSIWNDDTKAINQSKIKFPNPNDFMNQIDYQRELEQTFRTKWYNKQKWFKSLKYSKEDNSSIAYNVRAKTRLNSNCNSFITFSMMLPIKDPKFPKLGYWEEIALGFNSKNSN